MTSFNVIYLHKGPFLKLSHIVGRLKYINLGEHNSVHNSHAI